MGQILRVTFCRVTFCIVGLAWAGLHSVASGQTPVPSGGSAGQLLDTTLDQYCTTCHNDRSLRAGLSLESVRGDDVAAHTTVLEKVLRRLRTGEMPPPSRPRPSESTTAQLVTWLETSLDRVALDAPDPGAPAIHRLNRAEYRNAVRDLLGIDLDHARDLPADDSGYGFDNIGDVLTVSPLHIEKYVSAARRVSRLAVGTSTPRPIVVKYTPASGTRNEAIAGLPPNQRGGTLFRHFFPFDADYTITVRIRGGRVAHMPAPQLDVRVDGERVRLFEADYETNEANQGTRNYEVSVTLPAGDHTIGAGFLTEYATDPQNPRDRQSAGYSVDYVLVGGPFEATGVGQGESQQRIFVCRPEPGSAEEPCARRILSTLARRAYRTPVTPRDIDPLILLFTEGRADGGSFEHGIEMGLSGVLVAPRFLFRAPVVPDGGRPGEVYRLSDLDLASRLSFFLWSSIPDEELLSLAEEGVLSQPPVLAGQITRMIADPKSRALVDNFGGQWLHLRNVADWTPDPERYRGFNESLRYAFQQETELFLEHLIREDRSVLDLINADYTFVNERLADFYGIEGVEGGYFRRVSLEGTNRGGVLTQASVLMVTSYPTRTSPVLRGKWVLENLLGAPPPPPPPDVPALTDAAETSAGSLREALEQHRADPACAVCHPRMDPLGFALESFDAVGRFRTADNGVMIDDSGALPDGTPVNGPSGLRDVLMARRVEVVETLAEKLLTYAIGRGLEASDRPALREIRRRVESDDYRFSALVSGIVDSVPFRMRRIPER